MIRRVAGRWHDREGADALGLHGDRNCAGDVSRLARCLVRGPHFSEEQRRIEHRHRRTWRSSSGASAFRCQAAPIRGDGADGLEVPLVGRPRIHHVGWVVADDVGVGALQR